MHFRSVIRLTDLSKFHSLDLCQHVERNFFLPVASVRLLHLQPKVAETSSKLCYGNSIREKQVEIETCGELYNRWRAEKRYWKIPESGLRFKVPYIDTEDVDEKDTDIRSPVVLALHGSPGSYTDFNPLTPHLHKQGVRVIAPCFPNFNQYEPGVFRHSPEEKFQYIKDFLQAVNVSKVDMLLCHSSGIFPGLLLCLENHSPVINSLCLLNPTGLGRLNVIRPYWFVYTLMRMQDFPVSRELSMIAVKLFLMKKKLKADALSDHILSGYTLINSNFERASDGFKELLARNFPMLFAFSENDKLISKDVLYNMAHTMMNHSDITRYDRNGNLTEAGGKNPFRRAMAFENGSHFLLKKYPDIILEAVTTFLFESLNNIHCSS